VEGKEELGELRNNNIEKCRGKCDDEDIIHRKSRDNEDKY
jgi:hypothetical protein